MKTIESKLHPQFIKNKKGDDTFVVLSTQEYEELLEDVADLAAIAERKDEQTISIEELESNLKKDGVL